ncbi:MAG: DoxX family protein [Planctomycetota bacterium]
MSLSKTQTRISFIAQGIVAVILGQTLFFKLSGAEEAVAIFSKLGVEPYGRIGLGVLELFNVVLILLPRSAAFGGTMTVGLMLGAVGSHLGPLGINVNGDGGQLFAMAVVALLAGATVAWLRREQLPVVGAWFRG